ncbi:MAG: NAD(P)/FAD-dependent oxidoreductase [Deltaproteobacteria bacterium]|nr:MAG: NAD(P)/FAD-dependent oxidoreductase [Deltaproteobacteria bacterium]
MRGKTKRICLKKPAVLFLLAASVLTAAMVFGAIDNALCASPEGGSYDVVVIGAGGGGVSAAAKLALGGMKVLVIEQHDKVGGYMSSFERGPYRFEVSLHAMDGLGTKAFDDLGIENKVKKVKLDPAYRSAFPDFEFDVPADPELYRARLKEKFPHEAEGIDELFGDLELINYSMECLMKLRDKEDVGGTLWKILKKPWMFWPIIKYWNASCSEMMDDYIHDEKLISLFIQLMSYTGVGSDRVSGILFAMMWTSYHHNGFYYFEGGSQAVTKALAEVVEENGGDVLLSTLVTKIVIKDGKAVAVQTEDGKEFKGRYVVSNANAPSTFFELIGREHLPEDYVKRLESMTIGLSAFAVYLGVDYDYSETFPEGIHSYFINPGYNQAEVFKYYYEGIPEKAMFGLINYTMVDPTDAPEGKNVIAIVSIMPYDYKGDWYESVSYEKYHALKEEVAMKYIERSEKFLPGLREHIEVMEVGSPRTMEHYTLNPRGTIFGWEYSLEQSMLKRLPQETPIENLYLAGAWTFPGGGQSAVLMSGAEAARKILDREK